MSIAAVMSYFLDTCEDAARLGGKILLEHWDKIQVREKAPGDLVTQADLASQEAIYRHIRENHPDHDFLGEEDISHITSANNDQRPASEYRWIVDPLDGTTNYVHGLDGFSVSIGLEHAGELVAGVVYDPLRDLCYRAATGQGAQLNGKPLKTSGQTSLRESLLATSFSIRVERESPEIDRFVAVMQRCHSIRRLGSAALNFCYVAEGKLDGYWAANNKIWDIAAGVVILREAGGAVAGLTEGPLDLSHPAFAAAASEPLRKELVAVLAGASG